MFRRCALPAAMALLSIAAFAAVQKEEPKEAKDLPEGEGKKLLLEACTSCHELTETTKFKGFYDRKQWQDIVSTMVTYGAPLKDDQVLVLVDYLAKNLGKK